MTETRHIFDPGPCLSEDSLWRYIRGEASSEEIRQIEAHLADCDMCNDMLEGMQAFGVQSEFNASKKNLQKRFLGKSYDKTPWGKWIGIAASIIIVGGVSLVLMLNHEKDKLQEIPLAENNKAPVTEKHESKSIISDSNSQKLISKTEIEKKTTAFEDTQEGPNVRQETEQELSPQKQDGIDEAISGSEKPDSELDDKLKAAENTIDTQSLFRLDADQEIPDMTVASGNTEQDTDGKDIAGGESIAGLEETEEQHITELDEINEETEEGMTPAAAVSEIEDSEKKEVDISLSNDRSENIAATRRNRNKNMAKESIVTGNKTSEAYFSEALPNLDKAINAYNDKNFNRCLRLLNRISPDERHSRYREYIYYLAMSMYHTGEKENGKEILRTISDSSDYYGKRSSVFLDTLRDTVE